MPQGRWERWQNAHGTYCRRCADVVLRNNVIVGSVNANKRHWYKATKVLAGAERSFLSRLITRCESPDAFRRALHRSLEDIKVVIQFSEA